MGNLRFVHIVAQRAVGVMPTMQPLVENVWGKKRLFGKIADVVRKKEDREEKILKFEARVRRLSKGKKEKLRDKMRLESLRAFAIMAREVMRLQNGVEITYDDENGKFVCTIEGELGEANLEKTASAVKEATSALEAARTISRFAGAQGEEHSDMHSIRGVLTVLEGRICLKGGWNFGKNSAQAAH